LPVELSGGIKEKLEPVAGEKEMMVPLKLPVRKGIRYQINRIADPHPATWVSL
jgi:hypothetical protein